MREFDVKFGADFLANLPLTPGIYQFRDATGDIIYVGKAKRLRRRLEQYRSATRKRKHRRMRRIVRDATSITWESCDSHLDACLREIRLIQDLKPRHNIAGAFHSRYPFIGIDHTAAAEGKIRFVLTTTGDDPDVAPGATYFGAFRSKEYTHEAFFSLQRLLKFVGHQERSRRPSGKGRRRSYDVAFRRLPPAWADDWRRFFIGESPEALSILSLRLLEHPDARSRAAEVEDDLKALRRFWREEALPLARAVAATHYGGGYPVIQAERDPLFIRYRLLMAAEGEA